MTLSQPQHHFILLDNRELFIELNRLLGSSEGKKSLGTTIVRQGTGNTGFANAKRYSIGPDKWDVIGLKPDENAHLFAFYAMGQGILRGRFLAVAIAQARSLRHDLKPGDLAVVNEAVALPFPARFQDDTTLPPGYEEPVLYTADPGCLDHLPDPQTTGSWQKRIPVIRTGYFKHPTQNGTMEPWEARHIEFMKNQEVDTISYTPAGVFDARRLFPDMRSTCLNMIVGTEEYPVSPEWERHKKTLLFPALQMTMGIISRKLHSPAT